LSTNQSIEEISKQLTSLSDFILVGNDLRVVITTDQFMSNATQKIVEMSKKLPNKSFELEKEEKTFEPSNPQNYVKFDNFKSTFAVNLWSPFHSIIKIILTC
jgi:hypothetical protein